MAKNITYGLLFSAKDKASRVVNKIRREVLGLGRAAQAVGRGSILGGLALGGGPAGIGLGVAAGIVGAGRSVLRVVGGVVRRVVGLVQTAVGTIIRVIRGVVDVVSSVVGSVLRKIKNMVTVLTAAFAALTVISLKWAADFEQAMAEVSTIALDIVGPAFERLKDQVQDLAVAVGKDASEMARGLYQVISAGITGAEQSMRVLETAAKASIAGLTDLETASRAVTGALNAYGLSAEHAMRISNIYFESIRLGVFRFAELEHAVGTVAGTAAELGVSLEEVMASYVALTRANIPLNRAATALRSMLGQILKPTDEAAKLARKLGLNFGYAALKSKGLAGFLADIRRATGGDPELLAQLFPNRRALAGLIPLMGRMFGTFQKVLPDIVDNAGATEQAYTKMMQTLVRRWSQMWQQMKATARAFAEPLMDPVKRFLGAVRDGLEGLEDDAEALGQRVATLMETVADFVDRDWSFQKIKDALADLWSVLMRYRDDLLSIFGSMGEEGFEAGPLIDGIVAAFTWAFETLKPIVAKFWDDVIADLVRKVNRIFADTALQLRRQATQIEEESIRERARGSYWGGLLGPKWEELSREEQDQYIENMGIGVGMKARAKAGALRGAADVLGGVVLGGEATNRRAEKIANDTEAASEKQLEAANRFSAAVDEMRDLLRAPVREAGEAAGGAIPPPRRRRPGEAAAEALGAEPGTPFTAGLRKRAGTLQQTAKLPGLTAEQAAALNARAAALLKRAADEEELRSVVQEEFAETVANYAEETQQTMQEVVRAFGDTSQRTEEMIEDTKRMRREIQMLRQQVKRLSTARS